MTEGCTICGDPHYGHGLCSKHYQRKRKHGDPLITKLIIGDDRARFEAKVDRSGGPDACHPWTGSCSSDGYGSFKIGGRTEKAHIQAWIFENGPRSPGVDLDHECHNRAVHDGTCQPGVCDHRLCCNQRHLAPKTRQEHIRDTGWRLPPRRGSANKASKFTEDDVRRIRKLLAAKAVPVREIAGQYGVTPEAIYSIKTGKNWGWLPPEPLEPESLPPVPSVR